MMPELPPPWWETCTPEIFRFRMGNPTLRGDFIASHLPLVRRVTEAMNEVELSGDDLLQAGVVGLLKAIEQWEPGQGIAFEEAAAAEIENYVRFYWDSTLPRRKAGRTERREQVNSLDEGLDLLPDGIREVMVRRFGLRGHPTCTRRETAEQLGITVEEVSRRQRRGTKLLGGYLKKPPCPTDRAVKG